jgi:hypothetical protein
MRDVMRKKMRDGGMREKNIEKERDEREQFNKKKFLNKIFTKEAHAFFTLHITFTSFLSLTL